MVFSRSDVKRRNKEAQDPLNENPKRTKVHAQRKFAQGSGMNSPVKEMNLIKEKEKAKPTDDPTEELPTNQPPTEDFLSFLCFRGTKFLAPRLNVFNEVPSSPKKSSSSSKHSANSSGAQKHKVGNSPQELKKRLASRRPGLQKGNAVRARTASNERQAVRKKAIERQIRRKAAQRRAKPIRKPHPAILKRLGATRLRAGLRSGGQLPPGSDVGLKTDRKPKRGRPRRRRQIGFKKGRKMDVESLRRKAKAEEYEEDDEDDDNEDEEDNDEDGEEEEEEEEEEPEEKSKTIRKSARSRVTSISPAHSPKKQSTSGRPSRKTKEAATLYMEMLTKDLRNPDEEFDEDFIRNFPELPSTMKRDKSEELKKNSPKRGRQPKRASSPTKEEKSKIRKVLKNTADLEESSSPTLKRSQRNSAKKIIPRGKPVMKVKGRLLRRVNVLRSRNLPQINKSLRVRRRGRPAKNLKENIIDESEEDEEDEEEDEDIDEEEIIEDMKKSHCSKKSPESIPSKGMATRKGDHKKSNEVKPDKNGPSNQKKRKIVTESSSLSEDEEESEEEKPKKGNRSHEQDRRKTRVSDRRKSQKIEYDNESKRTTPKRVSLRNKKKELNESDSDDDSDEQLAKNPRRSKRNKDSDEDEEMGKKGKFTEIKKSKYKEDSDEDFDDEYNTSSKFKGSQRQKGNIKRENEEDLQRNIKKNDESKLKTNKVNSKNTETDEIENSSKKGKGRIPRSSHNKESDEDNEPLTRRSRNSDFKNTLSEMSDDEDELLVKKSTRGTAPKCKTKAEMHDGNKKLESEDDEPLVKKTRGSVPKGKAKSEIVDNTKIENEEDDEPSMKKTRGSVPKGKAKSEIVDNTKNENEEDDEPSMKKTRGSVPKGKTKSDSYESNKKYESDDESLMKKATRVSIPKSKSKGTDDSNVKLESEDDEPSVKKTRGSVPKGKTKSDIDDNNKKNESDDDEPVVKKATRGSVTKSKNKEIDDNIKIESEDEDEPSVKKITRGSVPKGKIDDSNVKNETDDEEEPSVKKITRGSVSKVKTDDGNVKIESDDEDEPSVKKITRGSVSKVKTDDGNVKIESDDDDEPSVKKITRGSVSKVKTDDGNVKIESDDDDEPSVKKTTKRSVPKDKTDDNNVESEDEDEPFVQKTSRGPIPKSKSKNIEVNKKIDTEKETNNEIKKTREIQFRKNESDEEASKKSRGLQKKIKGVDINEIKIEETKAIQNKVVASIERDFKSDKTKVASSRKPKKNVADKEPSPLSSGTPNMSEVEDNDLSKAGKIVPRGKAKKIPEDEAIKENEKQSKEISLKKPIKNNKESKEPGESSLKPGVTKKVINLEDKESKDEQENNCGNNNLSEVKQKNKRGRKPKKKTDKQQDFLDEIFRYEDNMNQCKIVSSSSTKNDHIKSLNVSAEYSGESKRGSCEKLKDNIGGMPKSNKKPLPNIVKKEEHSDIKSNINLEIGKVMEISPQMQPEVTYLTSDIINVVTQETIDIDIKKEREEYEIFLESVLNEEELKRKSKNDDIKTEIIQTYIENDPNQNKSKKCIEIKDIKIETPISSHSSLRNNTERDIVKPNTGNNDPKMINKGFPSRTVKKTISGNNTEDTTLPHKLIKPFSHLERDDVTKLSTVSPLSNLDADKVKPLNVPLRKDISTDKVGINVISDKIEGHYRYDNDNGNNVGDRLNFKKSIDGMGKKAKKYGTDHSSLDDIKKNKTSNIKNKDEHMKAKENELKKSRDLKSGESSKDISTNRRQTRLSVGSPERDDKYRRKFDVREKYSEHFHSDSAPKPTKSRKPALTARAQFRQDNDDDDDDEDLPSTKTNDVIKPAAPIKRKTLGERDSCDTIGSSDSSIIECKVVLSDISESIGDMSGDFRKAVKKSKNSERISEKTPKSVANVQQDFSDEFSSKDNNCSIMSTATFSSGSLELEKCEIAKPSLSDTWRQAFKNAKIPKPGHLSPVPGKHTVKPFVRQKPPNVSNSFPGKSGGRPEQRPGEANKSKTPQNLSPFKSMLANQTQRSLSPDAKKHLSPAHKPNFLGFESPVKRPEDIRSDLKKQEPPVKSLTQLQYEKRSSEFINSYLDPGPPSAVLPAFESIRAYKKEMKKEEPKEAVKSEAIPNPPPLTEPVVKPSPEGKHLNLPLAVEHTLRKNSPITVSKKPPQKPVSFSQEKRTENIPVTKPILPTVVTIEKKVPPSAVIPAPPTPPPTTTVPTSTTSQPLPPARDLIRETSDLSSLSKKKVNMTNEEINRWLNDSTSSGIEHKKDCGIFENNQCECSYRTSEASMQNSIGVSELVTKEEKIDHGVVEPPVQLKELDKAAKYVAETISTCKVEDYKEKLISKNNSPDNKMAPPRASRRTSGHDRFKSSKSMTEDEMCEYDFRFERTSNSPRESVSDVSSVTHRDDVSSSSEIPERKIFHQKRSVAAPKRPSLSSPTAFSAENESSIYAFDPDPPSTANKPFRRGRGKSGEQDDGRHPSSSSIAVQVNLNENEGGLECSTQTERPSDDSEGHLFYIPLPDEQLQSGLPQGVAVKLDTEGPDQRVIMRAKLVTKPNSSSFPSSASTSRAFLNSSRNTQKPEQKVRPLWSGSGRAPVGTVQPTLREPPEKSDQATTTTQEKVRSSSAQVSQSSQSTQINQSSPKGPDSPRSSRNSTRGAKQSSESRLSVESNPPSNPPTAIEWKGTEFPPPDIPPTLVEAPTFYPTEKEFQDPLEYIEQLTPLAQSFGICRIVPPSSFKPECKVSDDMRFTAYNQYVHKLMERWGPNVKELCAIKKYLTTQSITLNQLPLIGSMEVDLPRLYQTVQQQGGLKEVIEKKRWARVADAMRIPKSAQDRFTKLDDIYCKYLLPYDTLSHEERTKLFEDVEQDWQEREKRRVAEDDGGNNASAEGSDESSEADDNMYECISKGKNMPLSGFFRIARNTMYMWFKENSPSPDEVESEFWQHVSNKTYHVCVHCGSIDSGTWGYGFPTTKTSATSRHPWNLKVLTNSPGSILRSIGPLMGVTVPTLHVGMLFSSCCWYRDPHALPWIEYLHTGASKIWYGVPDSRASELRDAMYPLLPRHTRDKPIWLPSDTMMVPPQYLLEGGVSVCRVVQDPGQFILVFPKAFTSTISTGYIVSESVYFAQPSWLNSALQVFKDIQDSYEPPGFSLHKLLFSIANDARSSADILNQILPMLISVIEKEVNSRKKLEKLGLTSWEKLPSSKAGRRKKQEEEPSDLECDNCRGALFLSMVSNSNEECNYCIDHAIENLSKEQGLLKYCKLLFAYNEEEMEELINKVKGRIESKTQKKQKEKGASTSGAKN